MNKTWVIIADASDARVFLIDYKKFANGVQELELVKQLTHPKSRKHDLDLVSDRPGRVSTGGHGSSTYNEPTDPKQREAEVFAKELVSDLESARVHHKFNDLILIAPPAFYGLLNKNMHNPLKQTVSKVIEKDITHASEHELKQVLHKYFTQL